MELSQNHEKILSHAKRQGYLSPLWLLPQADGHAVKRAFDDLEHFLVREYQTGRLARISLTEVEDFIWGLKKTYAFHGWDGIAPYLLKVQIRARRKKLQSTN